MKTIKLHHVIHVCFYGLISFLICNSGIVTAKPAASSATIDTSQVIDIIQPDGSVLKLPADGDVDGDGISNELEVNGYYWDADSFKMKAWNGDPNQKHFITDPLQASTDQDPYSDYTEVSGVGLDVNVVPPDNNPLVAARPIISVKMVSYEVIPLATISDAHGGSQGSSYSNAVTNSTTMGVSVTEGVQIGTQGLNSNVSVSQSYSETHSVTSTTSSSSAINWNNTRTTQPDQAARLELILYLQNTGSAEALNIVTTVNLKLGDKIIATFNLPQVDALNPGQQSSEFNVANANGGDITVTLDELKALQLGAPLTLEVNQVSADVETLDNNNNQVEKSWNNFTGDINTVSIDVIATIGDNDPVRHQVFASWSQWDPQYTIEQILSRIFDVEHTSDGVTIDGRRYPDEWYISSPSPDFINEWENAGRPNDILQLTALRNTKIVMNSPGSDSKPTVNLASYSKLPDDDSPYSRVLVSAVPNNFPISLVTAEVSVNGTTRVDTLHLDNLGFYTNTNAFGGVPDSPGTVYVKNVRGDVTESPIVIPAIYKNAAEVKEFSHFLPNPGDDYWIYYQGDQSKPMLLYCQFFDLDTGDSLQAPREYLPLHAANGMSNFSDYAYDSNTNRCFFDKVRIDANNLEVNAKDTTFIHVEPLAAPYFQIPSWLFNNGLFGIIEYNPAFDTLRANIDLSGTPFYLSTETQFTNNPEEIFQVDKTRKIVNMYVVPEGSYVLQGPTGVTDSTIQFEYGNYSQPVVRNTLDGNALQLNTNSNDGFADAGTSDALKLDSTFTIEAWIYPTGSGGDSQLGGTILGRAGEYQMARFPDGSIRYAVSNGDSLEWKNSGYIAKENTWVHLALVSQRSGMNETKLYIQDYDGKLFKGFLYSGQINDAAPNMNNFLIGGRQDISTQKFQGLIDEVRIWNTARTEQQIDSTLDVVLGSEYYSTADSGLVGYWRFDQLEDLGVGEPGTNDVRDYSIYGNHLDLVGDATLSSGIPVAVSHQNISIPGQYSLQQNFPNPFNPETSIQYKLPNTSHVTLMVYNSLGQVVQTLVNKSLPAGEYSVRWNGRDQFGNTVSSGMYFYRLRAGDYVKTRKMILMK